MLRPLLIAAPKSGSGKTTVTLGLLAALQRRGIAVAPFKVGPDYIDPGLHARACATPSRNLDGWLMPPEAIRTAYRRGCAGRTLPIIEGVMGLFDGASGARNTGSSAEIALMLDAEILLVVDASSQARSVAALVKGFVEFDPRLRFAGIILNRVASENHCELLIEALTSTPGLPPVVGAIPRAEELALPERHLGLVTAAEQRDFRAFLDLAADCMEGNVDLDRIAAYAADAPAPEDEPVVAETRVRIAVARDLAFSFYYRENLGLLTEAGAELVPFSPLRQEALPPDIGGIYLGGGYPELYAEALAANLPIRQAIRDAGDEGMPILAECGGFMFLQRSIGGLPMAGVFPGDAVMQTKRAGLGYREICTTDESLLGPAGTVIRGHEFHYSTVTMPEGVETLFTATDRKGRPAQVAGYRHRGTVGSYVHLHLASNPQAARNFVDAAARYAAGSN